ncbi:damage-control phosphatase ARMT1 isoform X1 [Gopherus flavomarginatus]|uniref:damage-control phosphatase ARMT1 isoform X1 n=1 Tax=Gopherus flavomarginatus TaxID=286002 RepID=UPI0021CBA63E|nr:damage-control phosphatase ARMT1 isoform X1 [Gopherus flavomarginatus]
MGPWGANLPCGAASSSCLRRAPRPGRAEGRILPRVMTPRQSRVRGVGGRALGRRTSGTRGRAPVGQGAESPVTGESEIRLRTRGHSADRQLRSLCSALAVRPGCPGPFLPQLSWGGCPGSFAYFTIKDRLPQILTKVIDTLHRHKNEFFEEHGEKGIEAEKNTISILSKLRNELQTDKPLVPLDDKLPDVPLWNQYLEYQQNLLDGNEQPSWFQSPWLYVECYMYRRIHEALVHNPPLDDYDVFKEAKVQSFFQSQQAIITLCTYFQELLKNIEDLDEKQLQEEFFRLLQVSLWGNKCDLSFSAGEDNFQKASSLKSLDNLKTFILVDDMEDIWSLLINSKKRRTSKDVTRVDIVLDNAGYELITDLVLADFLLSSKLVTEIHFHGKCIPWYVSDTTKQDFNWTVKQLQSANNRWISRCGINWGGSIKKGVFVYHDHMFWTLPHEFCSMAQVAIDLYTELQKSHLIIFKGDLNYRKLTGDRKWEFTVPFHQALNKFHPAPLCSLRTLKSDVQVGLKPGQGEQFVTSEPDWMICGKYGVVQFDASL